MKYLAIDYGKKYIGLAVSDSAGKVAMPLKVLENNHVFFDELKKIISEQSVDEIVLGKSENLKGENNFIQKEIDILKEKLENLDLKVHLINEVFTSMEAK